MAIKEDCIMYQKSGVRGGCVALKECYCKFEDKCAFFKSRKEWTRTSMDVNAGVVKISEVKKKNG